MKRKLYEKTVGREMRSDLRDATPDVWEPIRQRAALLPKPETEKAFGRTAGHPKRRFARVVSAVLTVLVLAVGASALIYHLPDLQAKAETLYDSGGRLANITAAAPSEGFISSYNGFGLNLLSRLYDGKTNLFLSPASIYLALGMTYNGAQGQTANEIAKALGSGGSLTAFNQNCLGLQGLMTGGSFRLADSIWLDRSFSSSVSSRFLAADKTYFGASVGTLDFSLPEAPAVINRWVKTNTANKINMNLKNIDQNTVMIDRKSVV